MAQHELIMKVNMDTSEANERLEHSIQLVHELIKSIRELSETLIWVGQSLKIEDLRKILSDPPKLEG
jgi:hypothetical protein